MRINIILETGIYHFTE